MIENNSQQFRHWNVEKDSEQVICLALDKADASSNVLSHEVLAELDTLLDTVASDSSARGLIIASAKSSGFVFGADISEFDHIDTAEAGARLAADGQRILQKIEDLEIPSVAAINGFALGGGLELALACDYRVAIESYDRRLGLPEVQLGIQPGFGGTIRTVALLGPQRALDLILSGRLLSAVEAKRAGLVDQLTSANSLLDAAKQILLSRPRKQKAGLVQRILNLKLVRPFIAKQVRAQVSRRANPSHYPAPYAMLDLWVRYGGKGKQAYKAEANSIGQLFVTETSRNLVRVYRLREQLKNLAPKSKDVKRVHVIGAGVMGGDIASWCALRGLEVTLQDQAPEAIETAQTRASKLFAKQLKAPGAADAAKARLRSDGSGAGQADADVVIEAIVERLDIKQKVFSAVESTAMPNTILASNTSSLRIEDMAATLQAPERLVGLHFFNPVAKLPLVEVIHGENTDTDVITRATAFVTQIDKLPLPCRSAPGFVVNRVLLPYMLEALRARSDGYSIEAIDAAAVAFGMPVGPVELADQVGLDVALHVARILSETLRAEPPQELIDMVESGKLGKKSGEGFYVYADGKVQKRPGPAAQFDQELQDRLILPLLNECVACVEEGVVDDPDLVDAGVIFGTGFAPFRGGPLHYARVRGVESIVAQLTALAEKYGEHFKPRPGWDALKT